MSKEEYIKRFVEEQKEGFLKFFNLVYKNPALLKSENIYDIAKEYVKESRKKK